MIKLKSPNGRYRYYAPELIVQVSEGVDETFVWCAHMERPFTVCESPEQVTRKILEYKLIFSIFETSSNLKDLVGADFAQKQLKLLAGLKDKSNE